jgi:hypothetical protein
MSKNLLVHHEITLSFWLLLSLSIFERTKIDMNERFCSNIALLCIMILNLIQLHDLVVLWLSV